MIHDFFSYDPKGFILYMDHINNLFAQNFSDKEYCLHPNYPVTEKLDKSVRFVGSITNIFKPKYLSSDLANNRYFIIQDCLKTHALDKDNITRCSYYPALGLHTSSVDLKIVVTHLYEFLFNKLNLPQELVETHACSLDADILNAIKDLSLKPKLVLNSLAMERYRHNFGANNISGRNIIIFLNDCSRPVKRQFIATLVVVSINNTDVYCEVTIKPIAIIKYLSNIKSEFDCYPFPVLTSANKDDVVHIQDSLLVCCLLFRCELLPTNLDNQTRLFRNYVKKLLGLLINSGYSLEKIRQLVRTYEKDHFGDQKITDAQLDYLTVISKLIG